MTTREINLLVRREGQLTPTQKKQLATVKTWVPISLAVYLLILLVVAGANIYVKLRNDSLDQRISTTATAIQALTKNEGIYLILKQKVTAISKIINTRYQYLTIFDFFKGLELDNGKITQINLSRDGKTTINFSLNDSEAMDRVVTAIVNEAKAKFTSVLLDSVRLTENGGYEMELNIQV